LARPPAVADHIPVATRAGAPVQIVFARPRAGRVILDCLAVEGTRLPFTIVVQIAVERRLGDHRGRGHPRAVGR